MDNKRLEEYRLEPKKHLVYDEATLEGLVVKTQSGFYTVQTSEGEIVSQIAGTLKEKKEDTALTVDLVALGDRVTVERQKDGTGIITAVHERQTVLSRVAPSSAVGTSAEREQIIIANCTQAVFVFAAAKPRPQPRMLDRLLVAAEKAEIPSIVICVNKIDLVDSSKLESTFHIYEKIGYSVLYVSAVQETGIESLHDTLQGQVSVFTGPSGVGKSSLLNAVQPGLQLQTADVSEAHEKGKHTTRFSQLIPLDDGGYVADTPGIRAIAPWDVEPDELDSYFRDIAPLVPHCKFTDCTHMHEPDCAVLSALQEGTLTQARYESYLRLREVLEEEYIYL